MNKCLSCYLPLEKEENSYHPKCCLRLFSQPVAPLLDIRLNEIHSLAKKNIAQRLTVTGVQPKLSLSLAKENKTDSHQRLTIIGLQDGSWADFILKPPSEEYPNLPELEDLGMKLAFACKINTATHGLVRLKSGELSYICRRFDRLKGKKIPEEDMCQLTGLLTERKYQSSMEKVGTTIRTYATNPGNDLITFFDIALLSFLSGNADMHLKNFSLLTFPDIRLSPAYDLVPTAIVVKEDHEETALTINGKKIGLKKKTLNLWPNTLAYQSQQ